MNEMAVRSLEMGNEPRSKSLTIYFLFFTPDPQIIGVISKPVPFVSNELEPF